MKRLFATALVVGGTLAGTAVGVDASTILTWQYSSKIDLSQLGGSKSEDFILTYSFDKDAENNVPYEEIGSYLNYGTLQLGSEVVSFDEGYISVDAPTQNYSVSAGRSFGSDIYGSIFGYEVQYILFSTKRSSTEGYWFENGDLPLFPINLDDALFVYNNFNIITGKDDKGVYTDAIVTRLDNVNGQIPGTSLSPVPLPTGVWLLLSALGGLGFAGWRRKRVAAA